MTDDVQNFFLIVDQKVTDGRPDVFVIQDLVLLYDVVMSRI